MLIGIVRLIEEGSSTLEMSRGSLCPNNPCESSVTAFTTHRVSSDY